MATTQHAPKQPFYAGMFRRLGWEKREVGNLQEAETERPWAGLAEWLRAAHSMLDDKTVELSRNADR